MVKCVDGYALARKVLEKGKELKDGNLLILAGMITGFVNDMPESEAYTEAKKRIENMEKIIEDQQDRIDIMAADMPIHCKDCKKQNEIECPLHRVLEDGTICSIVNSDFYCGYGKPKGGE